MLDERIWCPIAKVECQDGFMHMANPMDVAKYKCPAWKDGKCSIFCLLNSLADVYATKNFATGFMYNDNG